MKRTILSLTFAFCISIIGIAQEEEGPYLEKGQFSIGMRTSTSLFGHDNISGLGVGGQMRWQVFDFLNTEWFTD